MAQIKTVKYSIEFSALETLNSQPIALNQGEYMKQRCQLEKQYEAHSDDSEEFPIEKREYERDFGDCIRYQTWYTLGTADIILTKWECKPGYKFI